MKQLLISSIKYRDISLFHKEIFTLTTISWIFICCVPVLFDIDQLLNNNFYHLAELFLVNFKIIIQFYLK
jgi:hypothetical protein